MKPARANATRRNAPVDKLVTFCLRNRESCCPLLCALNPENCCEQPDVLCSNGDFGITLDVLPCKS
ncbi:unnamed protein product [Pylaiella littoralis]